MEDEKREEKQSNHNKTGWAMKTQKWCTHTFGRVRTDFFISR